MSASGAAPARPRSRGTARELRLAVALCLLGAATVLLAVGRTWTRARLPAGPLTDASTVALTGVDLVAGGRALGFVGLAGALALLATRRLGRPAVGLLLALAGAGVVLSAVLPDLGTATRRDEQVGGAAVPVATTAWPGVTAAGGALLAASGLLAVARGRSWPAMGQRYEVPSAREAPRPATGPTAAAAAGAGQGERALWEALDRGEDPTDDPGSSSLGRSSGAGPGREEDRR